MTHSFQCRVYYEDTDLAGIVYYANYLKFIERARSEMLRDAGVDQSALKSEHNLVFAVRRIEADYLAPARFDDLLSVTSQLDHLGGARIRLLQQVARATDVLFSAKIELACLNGSGRAVRIPADIRRKLKEWGV